MNYGVAVRPAVGRHSDADVVSLVHVVYAIANVI